MAKPKYEGKLQQQKGTFTIRGNIVGKDKTTARKGFGYCEGTSKNDGRPWKSIRFFIKTSETNIIPVEVFGSTQDSVYYYSRSEKKTIPIKWAERFSFKAPDGYEMIPAGFDLADMLHNKYKDGDSVFIVGHIEFSTYENPNTKEVKLQRRYIIDRVLPSTEPVDFNSEDFIEENKFYQEITITDVTEDISANKLFVNAYVIGYGGSFNPAQFEIDALRNPKFTKNFKGLKFGDTMKVEGTIHQRATIEKAEEENEWGMHRGKQVKGSFKALVIDGVNTDTLTFGMYTEDDFLSNEAKGEPQANTWDRYGEPMANDSDIDVPFDLD